MYLKRERENKQKQESFCISLAELTSNPISDGSTVLWGNKTASGLPLRKVFAKSWMNIVFKKLELRGAWGAQSVKHLPSAQVTILGSWDRAPCRAPCSAGSLLLPLPQLPLLPKRMLSLSHSLILSLK